MFEEGLAMLNSSQLPSVLSPGGLTIRPLRCRTGLMLAGEADCTTHDRLHTALTTLTTLPTDGNGELHLDLAGLRFIDVCCTRELIAISERHPAVRLIVHCPPAVLRRITAILFPEATIEFIKTSMPGIGEADRISGRPTPELPSHAAPRDAPAPDIVELILAEHARISKLIENLDSALVDAGPASPESRLAWAALAGFLRFHVDAAAEIAYQALASAGPDAALAIRKASEADADIRAATEEACLSRPGSRAWHMAVEAACSAAKTHITCVESGLAARYQHHAAPGDRRTLGRQWVAFMTAQILDAAAP
jgi:hypothetical protein